MQIVANNTLIEIQVQLVLFIRSTKRAEQAFNPVVYSCECLDESDNGCS